MDNWQQGRHDIPAEPQRSDYASMLTASKSPAGTAAIRTPDDAVTLAGRPGRYHYFQFIALCLQFSTLAMADLIPIFYNLSPVAIVCAENSSAWEVDNAITTAPSVDATGDSRGNDSADYCGCPGSLTYIYRENQTSVIGDVSGGGGEVARLMTDNVCVWLHVSVNLESAPFFVYRWTLSAGRRRFRVWPPHCTMSVSRVAKLDTKSLSDMTGKTR